MSSSSSTSSGSVDNASTLSVLSEPQTIGLEAQNVPVVAQDIVKFHYDARKPGKPLRLVLGEITMKLIHKKQPLDDHERQIVYNVLKSFASLKHVDSAIEKQLLLLDVLKLITGDSERVKRHYKFPDPFPQIAAFILANVEQDLATEQITADEAAAAEATSVQPSTKRRKTSNPTPQVPLSISEQATLDYIMRNIEDRKIKDKATSRSANLVGHNGIAVGQWWPFRLCALRDGAHGAMQAGIAGTEHDGAYSIVVSGQYALLDSDHGSTLWYSGSKSHDNEDKINPIVTQATKALRCAQREGRSVRVLRGAGGVERYSPSCGLRYDGLYRIVREEARTNLKRGAYVCFQLVRLTNQAEMDLTRPNARERKIFKHLTGKN